MQSKVTEHACNFLNAAYVIRGESKGNGSEAAHLIIHRAIQVNGALQGIKQCLIWLHLRAEFAACSALFAQSHDDAIKYGSPSYKQVPSDKPVQWRVGQVNQPLLRAL